MGKLTKVKVIIPANVNLNFENAEKPKIIEIEKAESEYVNFDGQIFCIVMLYILDKIADVAGNKIGEEVYDFAKKIIFNKNEDIPVIFSIEINDFKANFYFKGISENELIKALDAFFEFLKTLKRQDMAIKKIDLRFDNVSKEWLPKEVLVDYFKQKLHDSMENFND